MMKIILFIQFVLSIRLTIAVIGMMIGAFIKESIFLWKVFTIVMLIFCILFIKHSYKELKK